MVSPYWGKRIEKEHKEKMEEFEKKRALKKRAEIEFKLHSESINFTNSEEKNG